MKSKLMLWYTFLAVTSLMFATPLTADAYVNGYILTDKDSYVYVNGMMLIAIPTDKLLYDVNDTIWVTYNLSGSGNANPTLTNLYAVGYLPRYNVTSMSEIVYFGNKLFQSWGDSVVFKDIRNIRIEDEPEESSSFIPIPYVRGTFNVFVRPAINGSNEYPDFLGRVRIYESSGNVFKDIYITREKPKIIITNITVDKKNVFTTDDTLLIHYYCKNNCSIVATDASLKDTVPAFTYGIDPVTKYKSLTTIDTGEFKQIVIPLANTGYTSEDDFIRITIEDEYGNADYASFFVYEPTGDVIKINKDIIFDVGTDTTHATTFNNTIGIVYRTPDSTSEYKLNVYQKSGSTPTMSNPTFISNYKLEPVVSPNNNAEFFILDGSKNEELGDKAIYSKYLYNGFYQYFAETSATEITTAVDFNIQQKKYFLWIIPYWTSIGTATASFNAKRVNMLYSTEGIALSKLETSTDTQIDLIALTHAVGLKGTLGNLIFVILVVLSTFMVLTRVALLNPMVVLAFVGLEVWYMSYIGLIDMLILVIIIVIVSLMYTNKLLKTLRNEEQPPRGTE